MKHLLQLVNFFHEAEKLKSVLRHSYLSDGRQEDVAQHTWRMALIAIVLQKEYEESLNIERVLKMIIIHDLPEVYAGDIPAFGGDRKNKHENEKKAFLKLTNDLDEELKKELLSLWLEYEAKVTPEAKYASAIDKIEAILQHNECDISTWSEGEDEFNLTCFDDKVAHSEVLSTIRELLRDETKLMIMKHQVATQG